MIKAAQFVQEWGASELFLFPSTLLKGLNIPEDAKTFLHEAGLPHKAMFSYSFTYSVLPLQPEQPPRGGMKYPLLSYLQSQHYLLSHWQEDAPWYYTGGHRYNAIGAGTGQIWDMEEGSKRKTLLHSSIQQYAEALLAYREYRRHFQPEKDIEPENKRELLQELAHRLHEADLYAMDDPPAIEQLQAIWNLDILPQEIANRKYNELLAEEIVPSQDGIERFWPRMLVDMEIHI